MSLVVLSQVTKRFHAGGPPAVEGLSLTVARGEILALLGPSGSGKTTTLRLIAGFETPDEGRITLGERLVAEAGNGRVAAVPPEQRHVGIVFQDYALFPHLTIAQNVGFGLHTLTRAARRERVREILDLVGLAALGTFHVEHFHDGVDGCLRVLSQLISDAGTRTSCRAASNSEWRWRARSRRRRR